jgi:hypothetical protein
VKYGEAQIRESFEPLYKRWVRVQEEEILENQRALQRMRDLRIQEEEEERLRQEKEELLCREEEARIQQEEAEARSKKEQEELLRREGEEKQKALLQKRAQQKREQRARKREKEAQAEAAAEKQRLYARDLVRRGEEIKIMVQNSLKRQAEEKKRILLEEKQGARCAWDSCENPASPTSKYCSRACSNKRARANYRKKTLPA